MTWTGRDQDPPDLSDDKVVFSSNSSPSESLMTHAVSVGVPSRSVRLSRMANSYSRPPGKVLALSEVC